MGAFKKFRLSRVPGSVLWIAKSWLCEATVQKISTDQIQVPTHKEDLFRAFALEWNLVFSPIPFHPKILNKGELSFIHSGHSYKIVIYGNSGKIVLQEYINIYLFLVGAIY